MARFFNFDQKSKIIAIGVLNQCVRVSERVTQCVAKGGELVVEENPFDSVADEVNLLGVPV